MAETRGSWTVDQGVARRWDEADLDTTFRAEWPADVRDSYEPLNDTEARPDMPGPYCVYERGDPVIVGQHTGVGDDAATEQRQIIQMPIQFTVHAKSNDTSSGKARAQALAAGVMAAFDPGTDLLNITPDCHVVTLRGADNAIREGDEEWAWVCRYDLLIDANYNYSSEGA